ncbi:MAG: hypothetical protein JXR44_04475 [Thiotrichales bacterium]|nr:hypothetical protein [Thiotrichales bacterium]
MEQEVSQFERLEILSLSQQRVQLAKAQQWQALADSDIYWRGRLQALEAQAEQVLLPIAEQLLKDNRTVMTLAYRAQQELNQERQNSLKNLSQVKAYLK